jgi:glycosyltransferase involved in cell wall biosynthesis
VRSVKLVVLTEIIAPYRIPVFNALAQRSGVNLHVIFLSENDPSLRQWRVYKDDIRFSYEVLPSWRRRLGKYNVLVNRGVEKALRTAAPEVVLCGGYSYLASWQAMRWSRANRVPFYVWVESTLADQRRGTRVVESLKRRFLESANGFVVPGRSSAEYLASFGISADRVFTAPNAVDVEFFSEHAGRARQDAEALRNGLGLPKRYFLFVGRLVRDKGVFDLLEAYGRMDSNTRSEVGVVFVGDGAARAELERQAATIVPGTVKFAGFVHREELATYYALSDMLVFPTYSDTWGLVVNEAMSCGLPVIAASDAGCTADLVTDGWNGRVFEAGNVSQLSSIMTDLMNNPEMRSRMGRNSRACIEGFRPEAWAAGIAHAMAGDLR